MAKGNDIKVDAGLQFQEWKPANQPPPMTLEGDPESLGIDTVLQGTITLSTTKFYHILKQAKEQGRVPVFTLVIPEDEEKKASPADDGKQRELEFKNDPGNSPSE